jgi:uncharacterized protein YkwD
MLRCHQVTLASTIALLWLTACAIPPGALHPTRPWPATANCPVPARSATDGPALVALINEQRAKQGLHALVLSPQISDVAHRYACEVAARNDISHVGSDGSTVSERLTRGGLSPLYVAENTAGFYRSPAEVMAAWMASPHHRENILMPKARSIGIGQADGVQAIWVANFAS